MFKFCLLGLILCAAAPVRSQIFSGSCNHLAAVCKHGTCEQGPLEETAWCRCDEGYGGDFCERKCKKQCNGPAEKCTFDMMGRESCTCQGGSCTAHLLHSATGEDPCLNSPCKNGRCVGFNGGFQCICGTGFRGAYCEIGRDNCIENKCRGGGVCVNDPKGYYCVCPEGRSGQFCEFTDCSRLKGICNHGDCISSPTDDKGFICHCNQGYEGEFCNRDRNECAEEYNCFNNGTCTNTVGGYNCECLRGFGGENCEHTVDPCNGYNCYNGGKCRWAGHTIMCTCPTGTFGDRCQYRCPKGFTGEACNLPIDRPICGVGRGRCYHGGMCQDGFCVCEPEYGGSQCQIRKEGAVNHCKNDPCQNGATCVNIDSDVGFVCACTREFQGELCENRVDWCDTNQCANGAICLEENNTFKCVCPSGFTGRRCELYEQLSCSPNPCANEGVCATNGSTTRCHCPYGFTGPKCEERVTLTEPNEIVIREVCKQRNCDSIAGNGVCDPECNQEACNFDGGDCSAGQKPFRECQYKKCADLFANGVCNQACNTEECLYDGMDCMSAVIRCPIGIREHCAARFGNGICDEECAIEGCGYDGGDCVNRTEVTILTDIRIRIQIDPVEFQESGAQTLITISLALRASVRIQRDETGPLVFGWDGENELKRIDMDAKRLDDQRLLSKTIRHTRSVANVAVVQGIVLYLEVQEICQTDCKFSTAQSVVDIIAAGLIKTNGQMSLGLPITEAMVASPKSAPRGWTTNQIFLVTFIGVLACGTIVGLIVVPDRNRKRKMVNATVWMPPTESSINKPGRSGGKENNQSNSSSQQSLLNHQSGWQMTLIPGAKRHCGETRFEYGVPAPYQAIYPDFASIPEIRMDQPLKEIETIPEEIPLHVQASGSGPIFAPITNESVNQTDRKYHRRALHWLAANANGKPEELIVSEAVQCIKAGTDLNARDCDENTCLMLAVKARRVKLVIVLMRAGANPTIYNKSERSALHEAVVNKDFRMMEILLEDQRLVKEIDELDRNGFTALMEVARSKAGNQLMMAELLVSKGAKVDADGTHRKESPIYSGRTALHFAAQYDNVPMIEFLLNRNANKDKKDESGETPLMIAAKGGHDRAVRFLVENGASLTITDATDNTAAQLATAAYHYEVAGYLNQMLLDQKTFTALRQQIPNASSATSNGKGRQTFKAVKRAASRKTPLSTSTVSRESNHLTPPPSDGSFSSPSPHYFHTTSSTPTALESSPEHTYYSDLKATCGNQTWYSPPPQFTDTYHQIPPTNHVYEQLEQMNNSFYC